MIRSILRQGVPILGLCAWLSAAEGPADAAKPTVPAPAPVAAAAPAEAARAAPAPIEPRPDTPANRALDQTITLEGEGLPLADILRTFAQKDVCYAISAELLEREVRLHIRVKDVPIREVIGIVSQAAGLKYSISPSGVVALYSDTSAEGPAMNPRRLQEMIERMRQNRGVGPPAPGANDRGERREPGARHAPGRGEEARPEPQGRAGREAAPGGNEKRPQETPPPGREPEVF